MSGPVLATIVQRIEIVGLSRDQIATLRDRLSYANPAHLQAVKLGNVPRVPATLTTLTERPDGIVEVPRGCTAIVRDVVPDVRWVDLRITLPPLAFTSSPSSVRDYQRAAIDAAVRGQQGVIVVPTGGGKTVIGIELVARLQQPALVLVPTLDLAQQWAERVRVRLGIDAGICTDGQIERADVMIATAGTLRDEARLTRVVHDVGVLIVDEAHHTPADTFARIVEAFPARFRFALTATPDRADGLGVLLRHYFGRMLYSVTVDQLADAGHLVRPTFERIETSFAHEYRGPDDWQNVLTSIVDDSERNALITRAVLERHDGSPSLVLTGRVQHAEGLAERIRVAGLRAAAIHGELPKRQRAEILDRMRDGTLDVLVGTTVADEGLDIPALSRVFLTFPSRSEARLVQRIGRIVRPHPGKAAPTVVDFVDENVGPLRAQARRRAAAFARTWRSSEAA